MNRYRSVKDVSQVLNLQSDTWYHTFRSKFVTDCFVGEPSPVCSNTLGLHSVVQGDHVEDVLTLLLWPAMSLNKMTKERSWSFNKKLLWSDLFPNRAHLSKPLSPSQLCDGDIDEVGVVDHLILNSYLHAMQTVFQIVTYCCNCQCAAELSYLPKLFIFARTVMFARTVHIRQNCSYSPG